MEANYIIDNKVSEQEFEQIVYRWLSEGDYTPDDLIENIISQNNTVLMPLYFSADEYSGNCNCSIGYQQKEHYTDYDINNKPVHKTRWITVWRPHSQPVQGKTVTVSYAGASVEEQISKFVEGTNWTAEDLNQITPNWIHYDEVCSYINVSKTDSWDLNGGKKAYYQAYQQTIPKLPSAIYSNLSLEVKFTEKTFFCVIAPYWLFRYVYLEKPYYVLVDGNDSNRIEGKRPEDSKRKNEVNKIRLFGWAVGLLAIGLTLYILSDQHIDTIEFNLQTIGIIVAGFILTGILVKSEVDKIKNKSKQIRQLMLTQKFKKLKQS